MTAFRHWRLVYHDIEHGGRRGEIAELEMRETAGGSDETGSGTITVRSTFSGSPSDAVDNDTGTKWVSGSFDYTWWAYDFGVSVTKEIVELSLRVNLSQTGPTHLRVDASSDGSTWIPQFYAFDLTWGTSDTKVFTFGPLPPPLRREVHRDPGPGQGLHRPHVRPRREPVGREIRAREPVADGKRSLDRSLRALIPSAQGRSPAPGRGLRRARHSLHRRPRC